MKDSKLKKFVDWCEENKLNPMDEKNLKKFLEEEEKKEVSKKEKKEDLVAKQKEIFKLMTEYVGVNVSYDEDDVFYDAFDCLIKRLVTAVSFKNTLNTLEKEE